MIAHHKLSEEEARKHPERHVITRALGVVDALEADIGAIRVEEGDSLLLCTDGISAQLETRRSTRFSRAGGTILSWRRPA